MEVSPRDVVAACLPDPAGLGDRMHGKTCAGLWVTGTGKDGSPRAVYLYHVVDNEWCMREYGSQAVVWQTAINPVVALELLAAGTWKGAGVLGPEAFDAVPVPRPADGVRLAVGHGGADARLRLTWFGAYPARCKPPHHETALRAGRGDSDRLLGDADSR